MSEAKIIDITLPASEEAAEAVVVGWMKAEGEAVEAHEPLLEVSTDKVTMEVAAPASGVLREIVKGENETVQPGDVLGRISVGAAPIYAEDDDAPEAGGAPKDVPEAPASPDAEEAEHDRRLRLSPLVKRMLREHDLDPTMIDGTGRGGRITHKDVQAYLARPAPKAPAKPAAPSRIAGGSRMVPHTPMRRRIAAHMVESLLHTAPHVTALFDADLTNITEHRKQHKASFAERGVRLTFTAYFAAAAAEAIRAVPEVNSRFHEDALEVFDAAHIGIATALGREGLIVPVIRDAQMLGLFGIAARLGELTEKARSGSLTTADVQGGTFTITNHGTGGSLIATPIISQPQSAILGIGKIEKRVTVAEVGGRDVIQISPRAYVSLTIDHRALDGFTANAFLDRFVAVLENWA